MLSIIKHKTVVKRFYQDLSIWTIYWGCPSRLTFGTVAWRTIGHHSVHVSVESDGSGRLCVLEIDDHYILCSLDCM